MKSQRYATLRLFSLILAASILLQGFALSGYSKSGHLVPSLALPLTPAAQDGGKSWKPINTGLDNLEVAALAIDPVNTATIYAGTYRGGMFKSTDGGATWSKLGLNVNSVQAIAVNFLNPNIIHVGSGDGGWCNSTFPIFKSTDGGASWSNANSPTDCGGISLLVIDPTNPNTLYAGSEGQYLGSGSIFLWKSTDGGTNWRSVWFGNPGLAPYGLVIDPANPQTLYAPGEFYGGTPIPSVIHTDLYKSTDGGSNWSATGLTNTSVRAVAIDPFNSNTIYAGSIDYGSSQPPFRGMLKSTDGGANWLPINNGLTNISRIMSIVVDRDNPSVLYIGTSGGAFKSTDGGANWSLFNDGLTNLYIRVLTLAPGNPNTLYAGTSGGVFKITENTPVINPIDEAQSFVRQHYFDFLNREPDAAGLAFWTNEITSCGTDQQCAEVKRVNVSAAFFLSIEFQETGYLAYRAYKAAYGDATSPGVPGTVPVIRLAEFLADSQRIGQGVQVGIGNWREQLEANKQAFALEFVGRQRFADAFPSTMSADAFVTELDRQAGGVLSEDEKAQLVSSLGPDPSDTQKRVQVLRSVAEDADLRLAEFNRAFVLMQYYGYLRRNPDDPQDTDFGGWRFWLSKLDRFNGNFIQAEMVKAFLVSTEYRQRFGQQ